MAKRNAEKAAFMKQLYMDITGERAKARAVVKAAREAARQAQEVVSSRKKGLRAAEKKVKAIKYARSNYVNLQCRICELKEWIERLERQLAEMDALDFSDSGLAAAEKEMKEAEVQLEQSEDMHETALWRLEQAKQDLQEVLLDTEADKSLWWDSLTDDFPGDEDSLEEDYDEV